MVPSTSFIVRNAKIGDLDFIYKLITSINDVKVKLCEFEILLKQKLKLSDFNIFILEEHSKSIEYAGILVACEKHSLIDMWPVLEIQELLILPKYRKLNGADFLYNYAVTFAKSKKAYRLKVNCNIKSTLNQNFYTTRGFKISKKQYIKEVY